MRKVKSIPSFLFIISLLFISCDTAERDWENAVSDDTIIAYELFLEKHPDYEDIKKAQSRLEELYRPIDWKKALVENSIDAYENYLQKHPNSEYTEEAHEKLDELYLPINYEKAKSTKTAEGYLSFLKRHSSSKEAGEILTLLKPLLYKDALSKNTIEDYERYLRYFPEGAQARKIKSKLLPLEQDRKFHRLEREESALPLPPTSNPTSLAYMYVRGLRTKFNRKLRAALNNEEITDEQYRTLYRRNEDNAR